MMAESVVSVSARVAVAWSLVYVFWRGLFTLSGADAPAVFVLFGAEVLAVVVFAARVRAARTTPLEVITSPDAPLPDTVAVVDAAGASVDETRATLLSLRRVVGIERVVVVDREASRWLRTIAARFDATVVAPSVTFDEAVEDTAASWVLVLRSGDLPMPEIVSACAPLCSAPEVAVVQVGIEEADPMSFDHDLDGHWSRGPFVREIVRPSLAARGSIPWYGDGPAMLRPSALLAIEGRAAGHVLDDSLRIGLDLIGMGMSITHVPSTLARVRSPHGLGENLALRRLQNRSALRSLRPRRLAKVDRAARSAHLLAVTPQVAAFQRLLLVVAAILILGFAQSPMDASVVGLIVLALPSYLLRWTSHVLLGRGRLGSFSILRADLRSLGVDLMPFGRVREGAGRSGLRTLVAAVVALDVAVVVGAVSMWRDGAGRLPIGIAVTSLVVTVGFVGIATQVLLDALVRHQRRVNHRVRLGLVTCRIEEHDGQLVDLSNGGAGVVVAASLAETPEVGAVTTVSFRIPDADGAWKSVSALVHVTHRSDEPGGGTRLGLSFDDRTDAPLDPVVEFLMTDRGRGAVGRRDSQLSRGGESRAVRGVRP